MCTGMENEQPPLYLTVQELATVKGVRPSTIFKAIREGRVPVRRLYGRILIARTDADAYEPGSYRGNRRAIKPRGPGRRTPNTDTQGTPNP